MSDIRYTVTYTYDDGMQLSITTTDEERVREAYIHGEGDREIVEVIISEEVISE